MSFEPVSRFLIPAAKNFGLGEQAMAGYICTQIRNLFSEKYPHYAQGWRPVSFSDGVLKISAENSAIASALYLRKEQVLKFLQEQELPEYIREIKIERQQKSAE